MSTLSLRDLGFLAAGQAAASSYDTDAQTYITAVETADGQSLETATRNAINAFVVGCKADGIWTAIKASCILAGARTLAGALVPLAGTAPTNNNFVSADYNRKTGLKGDGSTTKYINTNRAANADSVTNYHLAVFIGASFQSAANQYPSIIGSSYANACIGQRNDSNNMFFRFGVPAISYGSNLATGFIGMSRTNTSNYSARVSGATTTLTDTQTSLSSSTTRLFAVNNSGTENRIAFYSIGDALTLSQLNSHVSTLMNAFGSAIP